jgi:ferritin-like metal-binding protein YciE
VVCQLSECFCLRDANPDSQVRTLQNRSADLFAELRQVPAVANACQVAKSFIDTVNFDAGLISSSVVITRFDISAYSS